LIDFNHGRAEVFISLKRADRQVMSARTGF
jgi:hypothetical protein